MNAPRKQAIFEDAAQFFDRVVHVLQRHHRRGEEPVRRGLAEVGDPVVVGARQRIGHVGVFDQVESLGEPGRIEEGLVHAHRVHVAQARLRVGGALGHRMAMRRVEFADVVPRHPGPPDGVARDVRVHGVAEHLAVDLEIEAEFPVFAPQGGFAERAVLGFEISRPQLRGSTTWESLSNTGNCLIIAMIAYSREPVLQRRSAASGCERLLDFFVAWPPIGPFDLGDAVANEIPRLIDFVKRRALPPRNLAW